MGNKNGGGKRKSAWIRQCQNSAQEAPATGTVVHRCNDHGSGPAFDLWVLQICSELHVPSMCSREARHAHVLCYLIAVPLANKQQTGKPKSGSFRRVLPAYSIQLPAGVVHVTNRKISQRSVSS